AKANAYLPGIVAAVLDDANLAVVEPERVRELMRAAAKAAIARSCVDWLVAVGLGGADQLPAPRLLAALLRPTSIARRLSLLGLGQPRVMIFKAEALAIRVNSVMPLNPENTRAVTNITFAFLREYVERFHPTVASSVDFVRDSA